MKVKELIEHLKSYDPEQTVAYSLWSIDDVTTTLGEMGLDEDFLTEDEKNEVLDYVEDHEDAQYGIAWINFEDAIKELFKDKFPVEEEEE